MWRTGSTALAQCFLASDDYLVFYEPFHPSAGSLQAIQEARARQAEVTQKLRHPAWRGGYFDSYELIDDQTGRPLYALYPQGADLESVYTRASADTLAYIAACKRVAESTGKAAFFGFCRSGLQQRQLTVDSTTAAFYLYRDPINQFLSYNYESNRYFIDMTLRQLLYARPFVFQIREALTSYRRGLDYWYLSTLAKLGKVDRPFLQKWRDRMTQEEAFAFFLVSHQASLRCAIEMGHAVVSTDLLAKDARLRNRFEATYGISVAALRPEPESNTENNDLVDLMHRLLRRIPGAIPPKAVPFG